jgi:flagellar protein FliS
MQEPKKTPGRRFPVDIYRKTEVMTANRETILLMMYAGAIRFLKQAIEAEERSDVAERGRLVGRTQEIVNELRSTLNFEVGGEIATQLDQLYIFVTDRLIQGNIEKNVTPLKEALSVLSTLNSAWEEAIAALKKGKESPDKGTEKVPPEV